MLFQSFTRVNDKDGSIAWLMLCYDHEGNVTKAFEAKFSMPEKAQALRETQRQLPTVHLTPSEYKKLRTRFIHLVESTY